MKPRCPKCKAHQSPFRYIEVWAGHAICFDIKDDGCPEEEGTLSDGHPTHVEAICGCGHRWVLRGVHQITHVRKMFEP